MPTHKLLDAAYEKSKGDKKIGSTLKGIGPTYQDKIGRVALRVGDMLAPDFKEKIPGTFRPAPVYSGLLPVQAQRPAIS